MDKPDASGIHFFEHPCVSDPISCPHWNISHIRLSARPLLPDVERTVGGARASTTTSAKPLGSFGTRNVDIDSIYLHGID